MMNSLVNCKKLTHLVLSFIIIANFQSIDGFSLHHQYSPFYGYFVLPFDLPSELSGPLYGVKDFIPLDSTSENDLNGLG